MGSAGALELYSASTGIAIGAEALSLSGTGITSGGSLRNISGNNSYAGLITLGDHSRINSDSGTLTLAATSGNAITATAKNISFGGEGNITVNNPIATTSGTLSKDGSGTLLLSAANTYSGLTTISAGVLRAANDTALGTAAGGVNVSGTAALELIGGIHIGAEALNISIVGTGIGGAGALRNISGDNSYAGAISLGVDARINSDSGTLTLTSGATISGTYNLTFGGAGNVISNGIIGTGSGTLTKDGAGTLTLSATNTYTGITTVTAGKLAVTTDSALGTIAGGTIVASGARLDFQNVAYTSAEAVTLNGGTIETSTGTSSFTGNITLGASSNFEVGGVSLTLTGIIASPGIAGLTESYYSNGYFADDLTNFTTWGAGVSSTVTSINKSDSTQSQLDNFSYKWTGYFNPTQTGTYRFSTTSDDSSLVYIADSGVSLSSFVSTLQSSALPTSARNPLPAPRCARRPR